MPVNIYTVNAMLMTLNEHIEPRTLRQIASELGLYGKTVNGVKCYYLTPP